MINDAHKLTMMLHPPQLGRTLVHFTLKGLLNLPIQRTRGGETYITHPYSFSACTYFIRDRIENDDGMHQGRVSPLHDAHLEWNVDPLVHPRR